MSSGSHNAKLFINYRRDDTAPYAGRLYDRLSAHFGSDQVFIDIDQIEPGEDFVEAINRKVGACEIAIVSIGPNWLRVTDASGKRRLDDSEDFVRMEIVAALQRKIRVIPVLVGGARMPRKQDLPEALAPLSRRNAIELSETRFHADVDRLIEAIEKPRTLPEKRAEPSAAPIAPVTEPASVRLPESKDLHKAFGSDAVPERSGFDHVSPNRMASYRGTLIATGIALLVGCFVWALSVRRSPDVPKPSPETKDVGKKVVSEADLAYSRDLARWGIRGYRPASIDLSEKAPADNWVVPPFSGLKRLYGILHFGIKTKISEIGVILDVLDDKESQMVFTFDGVTNFIDKPVHRTVKGALPDPVEFQIEYPGGIRQRYAIRVYYPVSFAQQIGAYRLHYYRASVRQGKIKLGQREYPVAIADDNTDGNYSDLKTTQLFVDSSGDGQDGKLISLRGSSAFSVAGTYYIISNITPSGGRITVAQAGFGEVVGQVVNAKTGAPLPGAKIKLLPNNVSAVTAADGRYRVEAPEGEYWELSVTLEGYVPQYLRLDKRVEVGKSLTVDVALSDTSATDRSGIIRLATGDSFHFLSGERSKLGGGDFYFGFSENEAKFWANNGYQNGVYDLGDLGNVPLTQVKLPPADKYYRFGVPALPGHTYVSPAKTGEEGHYVIFRVTDLKMGEYVELEFYYR